jgi:hypothetical protein
MFMAAPSGEVTFGEWVPNLRRFREVVPTHAGGRWGAIGFRVRVCRALGTSGDLRAIKGHSLSENGGVVK